MYPDATSQSVSSLSSQVSSRKYLTQICHVQSRVHVAQILAPRRLVLPLPLECRCLSLLSVAFLQRCLVHGRSNPGFPAADAYECLF